MIDAANDPQSNLRINRINLAQQTTGAFHGVISERTEDEAVLYFKELHREITGKVNTSERISICVQK